MSSLSVLVFYLLDRFSFDLCSFDRIRSSLLSYSLSIIYSHCLLFLIVAIVLKWYCSVHLFPWDSLYSDLCSNNYGWELRNNSYSVLSFVKKYSIQMIFMTFIFVNINKCVIFSVQLFQGALVNSVKCLFIECLDMQLSSFWRVCERGFV